MKKADKNVRSPATPGGKNDGAHADDTKSTTKQAGRPGKPSSMGSAAHPAGVQVPETKAPAKQPAKPSAKGGGSHIAEAHVNETKAPTKQAESPGKPIDNDSNTHATKAHAHETVPPAEKDTSRVKAGGKSGGAVVIPRGARIQKAVDETEVPIGKSDEPLKPTDVRIDGVTKHARRVVLDYRIGKIYLACVSSCIFIGAWCVVFMFPITRETVDANKKTRDQVRERLKAVEESLSIWRTLLSTFMSWLLGLVVAVFCLQYNLHSTRTKIGTMIEWIFKNGLPYVCCLPLAGLVYQEQPMDVVVVMGDSDLCMYDTNLVQVADNASIVQGSGSLTRTATTDTILRRVLLPPRNQIRHCDIAESQAANAFTSVAYEFLANDFQERMLPNGMTPTETFIVPGSGRGSEMVTSKTSFTQAEASLVESLFTRGVYLHADAVLVQDADLGGKNAAELRQLKVDTIAYSSANNISATPPTGTPVDHIATYVRTFFDTIPAWSSLMRANVSDITVEYAKFKISRDINFTSVNIDIPLDNTIWHRELAEEHGELVEQNTTWPGQGYVQYEFDVSNECGPFTCGIQNRGLAPDPKVVAYGVCTSDTMDCGKYTSPSSMWLFGFGRRIGGDRLELLDSPADPKLRKAVLTNPREFHRITMGLLAYDLTELDERFDAKCNASSCVGVSMQLTNNSSERAQFVAVNRKNTPMLEFGSGFDLSKNHARGRPLITRYTTGARVEYEILRPQNFDEYEWPRDGLFFTNCSGKMERSIIGTELNIVYMERPLQVTYTAGLFFLFQNARMTSWMADSTKMDFIANSRTIRLALTVPLWQAVVGLVLGCFVTFVTMVVLLRSTHKIGVWSAQQLQLPDVMVRALVDSNVFPKDFFDLYVVQKGGEDEFVNLRELSLQSVVFGPLPKSQESMVIGTSAPEKPNTLSN